MPSPPAHDPLSNRLAHAQEAVRATPGDAVAWVKLGLAYLESRQVPMAAGCYAKATELAPNDATTWARLGKVLLSMRKYDSSRDAFRRASEIEPRSTQWLSLLGFVLREQNDIGNALAAYAQGLAVAPEDLQCAVASRLLLPHVFDDAAGVLSWRNRYEEGLAWLHAELPKHPTWPAQVLGLEWENFVLAYQGLDDTQLQQRYADFLSTLLGRAVPQLQSGLPRPSVAGRRIRVGFVSSELRTCTIGDYFSSWILGLPRDRFEVWCYFTGHAFDDLTAKFRDGCDRFHVLDGSLVEVAGAIRNDPPDVLIHPDVGLTAQSHLLANLRLAPVQCAAWGHPVTTGSRHIDCYLSTGPMEPEGAGAHYRERLELLPGLGTRYELPAPPNPRPRSDFGLSPDAHIYACPSRLHKLLPEHDDILTDIMARDPHAVFVFFDALSPGKRRAFVARLQRAMAAKSIPPRQQVKFLPVLPRADFRSMLAVADVMLDTPNFSGGSSALDAFSVGLPVVAREGAFMRGRQSAAMARILGVEELVATDAKDYVERALRIAGDPAFRRALSARIVDGLPRLFNRDEPVARLAETLVELTR